MAAVSRLGLSAIPRMPYGAFAPKAEYTAGDIPVFSGEWVVFESHPSFSVYETHPEFVAFETHPEWEVS